MQTELNYNSNNNSYHATFNKNILNIYNSQNKLLSSKAFSQIVYSQQAEELFKSHIDNCISNNINKPIHIVT